ncbi:MAG: hypothetical protein OXG88_03260 [Gammaproteobacteria bacterium]|nr:hypothetical protein [Gammaproteobacteria bacterium]
MKRFEVSFISRTGEVTRFTENVIAEGYVFNPLCDSFEFTVKHEIIFCAPKEHLAFIKLVQPSSLFSTKNESVQKEAFITSDKMGEFSDETISISGEIVEVDPDHFSDLTYTKVINGYVEKQAIGKRTWRRLLDDMLIVATEQLGGKSWSLQGRVPFEVKKGVVDEHGYGYIDELNVSIRHMSANDTCSSLVEIARIFGIEFEVTFEWQSNKPSKYPGKTARLHVHRD